MKIIIILGFLLTALSAPNDENHVSIIHSEINDNIFNKFSLPPLTNLPEDSLTSIHGLVTEIATQLKEKPVEDIKPLLKELADKVVFLIAEVITTSYLNIIELPDAKTDFNFTNGLIPHLGDLCLSAGWCRNLSNIKLIDITVVKNGNPDLLEIIVTSTFEKIQFGYNYIAKLFGLGPSGSVEGTCENPEFSFNIVINLKKLGISLEKFKLITIGVVSLKFLGIPLVDWLLNLLINVVIILVKTILSTVLTSLLQLVINALNVQCHELFP